jgi:hypothetical protein
MEYKPEVKELIDWLDNEENTRVKLASIMGYRSCLTVLKWIQNNHIPFRQRETVLSIIRGTYVSPKSNH